MAAMSGSKMDPIGECPSFRELSFATVASAAPGDEYGVSGDDGFEFSFSAAGGAPVYPIFNRDWTDFSASCNGGERREAARARMGSLAELMRSDSSASSSEDDLEGVPEGSYCLWKPLAAAAAAPPAPVREFMKKSNSTGSSSRRWKLRDLVVGRSYSDGKKKFAFLAAAPGEAEAGSKGVSGEGGGGLGARMDVATAHRMFYSKGEAGRVGGGGKGEHPRRLTFLPYREEIVGFFPRRSPSRH